MRGIGIKIIGIFLGTILFISPIDAAPVKPQIKSISLKEATDLALKNNRDIIKARANLKQSEYSIDSSYSHFFPKINVSLSAGTYHDKMPLEDEKTSPTVARDRNQYQAAITLNQNIFSGFKDSSSLKKSKLQKNENVLKLKATTNNILLQVTTLYYEIELKQTELKAEQEVYTLRKRQLADSISKKREGRSTKLQLLQAEFAVKAQEPTIKIIKNDIAKKTLELSKLIGLDFNQKIKLKPSLNQTYQMLIKAPKIPLVKAYEQALKNNPTLQTLIIGYDKSKVLSSESTSRHFPKVNLSLTANTSTNYRNNIASQDSASYGGEVTVSVPIFTGLSSFSERKEIAESLLQKRQSIIQEKENLLEQINSIYRDIEILNYKLKADEANLALINETVKQSKDLFSVGRATMTEVLDSYSKQLKTRKEISQSKFNRIIAHLKLKTLLGQRAL